MKMNDKIKRFCFVAISTIFAIGCISAQVNNSLQYEVEIGYALSAHLSPSSALREPLNGALLQVSLDYRFPNVKTLGLKASLGYKYAGYFSKKPNVLAIAIAYIGERYEESINEHSIFLPLRLTFNYDISEQHSVRILVGPRLSYIWEQMNFTNPAGEPNSGSSDLKSVYMPLNCSLGIGLGYSFKRMYVEASFDQGLYNRVRKSNILSEMNVLYNREFSLTVGLRLNK